MAWGQVPRARGRAPLPTRRPEARDERGALRVLPPRAHGGRVLRPPPRTSTESQGGLTNDLRKGLCSTPGIGPLDFRRVELDGAERARSVLATAEREQVPSALAAAVSAMTAEPRQTPPESGLLSLFAAHGELEGESAQEWLAGALGPLNALVPDGAGDGLRGVRGRASLGVRVHGRFARRSYTSSEARAENTTRPMA